MEWIIILAGVLVLSLGILDVFFTVLHYDGFGFLSSRLYNSIFNLVRFLIRSLPRRWQALGRSMAAPLMVPVTITVWISLVALGYALVYYAGMSAETFLFSSGRLAPSFMEALYSSGVSIATRGLGDVTPLSSIYQAISVSEALVGFGILTLSISYVIGVYEVLQRLGVPYRAEFTNHFELRYESQNAKTGTLQFRALLLGDGAHRVVLVRP
jgi:hypothetical protein